MGATAKYKNLNKEQQESLALCYLEEITKKYSKKEYQAKIEIELKRIQQATITLCAKNIGVSLGSTEIAKEEVKDAKILNEGNFSRNDIIGVWRDENSKFFFNEDATFLVKFDNGDAIGGKWWINQVKQIVCEGYSVISVISITENELKYEQKFTRKGLAVFKKKKIITTIYTATRVK